MAAISWEVAARIATTLGFPLTVVGLGFLAWQLKLQRRQTRLEALDEIYSTLDTHEARLARQFIYHAPAATLRLEHLHKDDNGEDRRRVEDTIASLDRVAYRVSTKQIPERDAFNLYAGVLLSVAYRVWPYIQDQREMREKSAVPHTRGYRRYLEALVRKWASKYADLAGISRPSSQQNTEAMLKALFDEANDCGGD